MDEKIPEPRNIFEAINQNVNVVNKNVLTALEEITSIKQEVIALSLMFKAPEKPNASGEEGAKI